MTKISEYPIITNPTEDDILIGTDVNSSDVTKNFSIGSIVDLIGDINQGPIGPQGDTGPTGPQGPVGPAGLEWQGAWNKNTSYVEDDAVAFSGASYFCILDIPGSSLNQSPENDTTHWALLASQGAVGPTGPAGPIGPQGPQGDVSIPNATIGSVEYTIPNTPLTFDINTVYNNGGTFSLPSLTSNYKGKEIIVQCTTTSVLIKPSLLGATISSTNINGYSGQFQILENQRVKFVYLGNDYWFTVFLNPIAPVYTPTALTQGTISIASGTTPYSVMLYDINVSLLSTSSHISLPTSNLISGKEIYIQTVDSIEIHGNPLNDGATQIFDVSGGSSTSIITSVGAFYKFTYLGVLSVYSPGARWVYQKLNQ
jgi:hypothetical protein